MRHEKFIIERYSRKKGHKAELCGFQVSMHYTENGVRKSLKKTFAIRDYKSRSDALKAAMAYRDSNVQKVANAVFTKAPENYTVDEIFAMIPQYYPLSVATVVKNTKVYDKYIKPEYGNKKVTDIHQNHVQMTLNACAEHCVEQHVRNVKSVWKKIFAIAIDKDIVTKDQTKHAQTPHTCHVTERSLGEQNITEEDFQKFCEALAEYGHYLPEQEDLIYNRYVMLCMVKLMRVTGIRCQEVRAIHRQSITFETVAVLDEETGCEGWTERAMLSIRASIGSTINEKIAVRTTKTPQSVRVIPVYGEGADVLHQILSFSKYDLVFAKFNGHPFSSDEVSDYFYRVSRACGIKVYPTLLRKSFSSDMYKNRINPAAIRKLMGHKSENMSANWYATTSDEEMDQTMQRRESLYKTEN